MQPTALATRTSLLPLSYALYTTNRQLGCLFLRTTCSGSLGGRRCLHTGRPAEARDSESPRNDTHDSIDKPDTPIKASDKLFADALLEEEEQASTERTHSRIQARATELQKQYPNWTGDEDVKDAVLRMLVDKYKPLRSGEVQTAEEKMKREGVGSKVSPPSSSTPPYSYVSPATTIPTSPSSWTPPTRPSSGSWANEPLLPSNPSHNPWDTTYKVPSHDVSSIKLAHIPTTSIKVTPVSEEDLKQRRREREAMKRGVVAGRLTQARESTLDYKLGLKRDGAHGQAVGIPGGGGGRPNPASVKGWANFVEDRIEKARKAGLFNNVKGRGKPLARSTDEHNPFIAREEFLMNRIVQRNGAAPAWVTLQNEHDEAVRTFRSLLRASWTRHAIRTITSTNPAPMLLNLTLADIQRFRSDSWLHPAELRYLQAAVKDVNDVVRRYNGVAPYIVRRGVMILENEVGRVYDDCAEDILRGIKETVTGGRSLRTGSVGYSDGGGGGGGGGVPSSEGDVWVGLGLGQMVKAMVKRLGDAFTWKH
ncbi:hypothetical protein CC1G_08831 [Coprinopsis cinerea okayama7|uniref:DnaJ homologue subfamily C member 28 conserved domain-containing protein n=1 Tax=Coprinopsis cinerea (strain Okayama-7 / 130 / ATCC MYA-4618 / FGSC 9003) TaxID=240176 RepID=A8P691_COPC7|nr:hypothetical protein CC1G_08831 [Coprinopsis cinerea okayama7\|eukprot:XP_001839105.2 hypothetical protein CC1G_08831 [Coprinopsis cinerea okayama7\